MWTPFFASWELVGRFPAILEDDVVGKAVAYVLPSTTAGGHTLQPYYEGNNEFSIRVTA